ncbi:MAG: tRNA dihydrouridine synthase DusB [Roseburia sp.]|nr:tRNA dihydrouridine synthase DusB [Anaeroplasma bactoclasticum]MCM1195775.1 tRNA dihydrouridine synthase DusB [Roseburia sp.]MCM1557711.1 tRNA dihydrouridine synthase DusB [Anaeroplasma bactoclasticum]
MQWKIRDITIPNQLVLAPMAGITNEAFRILCKEMGCGLVVAEMVSDKAIGFQNERTLKMTKVNPIEHPISMQIFGGDVESLVQAARYIDVYSDADIIDINMGCPVNKVAKKSHAGAALLTDPNLIFEIVSNVVENVSKPVTVKIRIGWDLDSINAVEVAKKIEAAGASAITVHGRTRSQFYSGKADLEWIKKVKEAVSIPVIGNGDIVNIASAKHMLEYTGVDAIAIGRGALGNPFIFRELYNYFKEGLIVDKPSNKEILDTIKKHHQLLLELKGEKLALLEMRGHVAWYLKGKPGSAKIKDLCNKQTSFSEVLTILESYFNGI